MLHTRLIGFVIVSTLIACSSKTTLDGAVAKGPFIQGSTVTLAAVSADGAPTGATFITQTSDDAGPLGATMLQKLCDPNTALVLDSYLDADGTGQGGYQ